MVNYCPYCGAKTDPTQRICNQCHTEIEPGVTAAEQSHITPASNQNVNQAPIPQQTTLWEGKHTRLIFGWGFPNLQDSKIYNTYGQELGAIGRQLSEYGIDYTIIDTTTKEILTLIQRDETHYEIVQNKSVLLAQIERRKVKSTIEVRPTPDSTEFFTQAEEFVRRKSIYYINDETKVADVERATAEEIPPGLSIRNPYNITFKRMDSSQNIRKILPLIIVALTLYRAYPYR
jgi:hypothetical protein